MMNECCTVADECLPTTLRGPFGLLVARSHFAQTTQKLEIPPNILEFEMLALLESIMIYNCAPFSF